jgi:MFS family permease
MPSADTATPPATPPAAPPAAEATAAAHRPTQLLLNLGHAIDHMFLLIFATAVTAIAQDFGLTRWEDLMPYGVLAFLMFGLGSLPAGKLGDQWGRRAMMVVFFVGIGTASIGVALAHTPLQLALALGLLGTFAAIYHPVGIPMLLQGASRPGWTIGVNGLAGNLGIAVAALVTGFLVKHLGWRAAFVIPGVVAIACGIAFARLARQEGTPAARRAPSAAAPAGVSIALILVVMTLGSTTGNLLFNLSTNANYELLADRLAAVTRDPALVGALLAGVYTIASFAQLVVGRLIDRVPLKTLYLGVVVVQGGLLALATQLSGWAFYAALLACMAFIFGSIPFTDAMLARYVDDRMRSRVAGLRLTISLGASSAAVWVLGPLVKAAGFTTLLWVMAGISLLTFTVVTRLPAQGAPAR